MVRGFVSRDQATSDGPDASINEYSTSSDNSAQASSDFDSESPHSSGTSSVPPRAEEWDRTLRHVGLEEFGKSLEKAASAVYPNDKKSRYSKVYVLLIRWETQDPKLPVEREMSELGKVFEEIYHYDIEEFWIPDAVSHGAVSKKINAFVEVNDDSSDDLKIVYYAGHSRLSRTKELLWSTLPDRSEKCSVVVWSGIQRSLEMAQSDVLILLDCCSSGVANSSEGNGVTELICASPFDTKANGVGHYSFTRALITELRLLSKKPRISVGELYTHIYTRIQSYLPQGIENERYPAPVHLVLTDGEPFTRGIKLSVHNQKNSGKHSEGDFIKRELLQDCDSLMDEVGSESSHSPRKRVCVGADSDSKSEEPNHPWIGASETRSEEDPNAEPGTSSREDHSSQKPISAAQVEQSDENLSRSFTAADSLFPRDAPRALFVVRFREDVRGEDLSVGLFREWLRSIPAAAEEVRVEAGFKCFSTLILITVPIAMCSYIPQSHAIFFLGAVKSPLMLPYEAEPQSFCSSEERTEGIPTKHSPDNWSPDIWKSAAMYSHKAPIVKSELPLESKLNILKYLPPYTIPTTKPELLAGSSSGLLVSTAVSSSTSTEHQASSQEASSTSSTVKGSSISSSPFVPTSQAKPVKARRIPRPKVKSGCDNCKNRRVKCDKERPQCQRCVRFGRVCNLYPSYRPKIVPSPPASIVSSTSPSITSSVNTREAIVVKPPTALEPQSLLTIDVLTGESVDVQEEQYFQLFRTHVARELSGYFSSEFWTKTVLQESHSEPSIRQSAVALGALYKSLESGQTNERFLPERYHYNFALQQWGKAFKHYLLPGGPGYLRLILFACFETLTGNYKSTITDLQHTVGAIREFKWNDEVEGELVQIIKHLTIQVKFADIIFHFSTPYGINLVPPTPLQQPTSSQSPLFSSAPIDNPDASSLEADLPGTFATALEARSALNNICEDIMHLAEQQPSHHTKPDHIVPLLSISNLFIANQRLFQWSVACSALLYKRHDTGVTINERSAINSLQMIRLMASTLFRFDSSRSEVVFDMLLPQFRETVNRGKEVLHDEEFTFAQGREAREEKPASYYRPSFTLEMSLVAPLFVVAAKCRERNLRREAITLLRSRPRREGLWDSIFCAKVAEVIMEIEEKDLSAYVFGEKSASENVPDEKRVMIKEISFDLQQRNGILRYGTKELGDQIVERRLSW